jgi:hypothetical protein
MNPTQKPSVATAGSVAYAAAMLGVRLLQLLTLLAMILAPVGMATGHDAMAAPAAPGAHTMSAMATDHCAGMDQPAKPQPPSCVDCNMVCAALPAVETAVAVHPIAAASLPRIAPEEAVQGLHPESDPPPPRLA